MNIIKITGRKDYAAYTFVAESATSTHEKTISAPNEKIARKEFWESLTDDQRDNLESLELIDVERF
jgi:hypothetical protein